ncbi:hypothetical protein IWQ56_002381 [Coemansia nantahalensis]|uniref:Uncharacterized protein n=2 Tax=Coemansia TaxID=4863 RepID=A0ACC1LGL9_9FUNG|nr:hypothetical protein IWQ56_002381 [Coemansia nantahalensis]KAJ2774416.1 hypothetical protein IWQ57_000826 [Coemansia nantahalensis]KAJ2807234.1 hypothetical protein H4R21_000557 [Coemansia helicoidea]
MVCVICQDSVVRAAAGQSPAVSALVCGHTFHGSCIKEWFRTSARSECPMCTRVHYGQPISLYLELDNDSAPKRPRRRRKKKGTANQSGSGSGARQPPLEVADDLSYAELLTGFGGLSMYGYGDQTYEIQELEERVEDLETELATQASDYEERLRRQKDKMQDEKDALQDERDALEREVNRLYRLSDAHVSHISSLQRALERERCGNNYY